MTMKFNPTNISNHPPYLYLNDDNCKNSHTMDNNRGWIPALEHSCQFPEEVFIKVMLELISNPNINSSLVLRADVLFDSDRDGNVYGVGDRESGYERDEEEKGVEKGRNEGRYGGLLEEGNGGGGGGGGSDGNPIIASDAEIYSTRYTLSIQNFLTYRRLIRRFVPRNPKIDNYLNQTCQFLRRVRHVDEEDNDNGDHSNESESKSDSDSLIIYIPHVSYISEIPFYHPPVRAICFFHQLNPNTTDSVANPYTISIHYLPFSTTSPEQTAFTPTTGSSIRDHNHNNINITRLNRTLHHLLHTLHKHGHGLLAGYTKRVHHDLLISKNKLQDRYLYLKSKHSDRLITNWVESTDPRKHVFEDLLIASFLIELWGEMYFHENTDTDNNKFPGFVDIGCGNGVLVDILRREGYDGYGIDARKRKTWNILLPPNTNLQESQKEPEEKEKEPWLREGLLVPYIISSSSISSSPQNVDIPPIHPCIFPKSTFLISNHSDQLTGWTPLLSTLCQGSFLAIPCCSYNLHGDKFRHNVKSNTNNTSQYASLCAWVEKLTEKCGYVVEKEILRIPSTRNVGILGRFRKAHGGSVSDMVREERVNEIIQEEGGADGWAEKVMKLAKPGKLDKH